MPAPSPARLVLCFTCASAMTEDEAWHYLYHCHECAIREHDLIRLLARDPGHPDRDRLDASPVHLGEAPPRTRRRAAA